MSGMLITHEERIQALRHLIAAYRQSQPTATPQAAQEKIGQVEKTIFEKSGQMRDNYTTTFKRILTRLQSASRVAGGNGPGGVAPPTGGPAGYQNSQGFIGQPETQPLHVPQQQQQQRYQQQQQLQQQQQQQLLQQNMVRQQQAASFGSASTIGSLQNTQQPGGSWQTPHAAVAQPQLNAAAPRPKQAAIFVNSVREANQFWQKMNMMKEDIPMLEKMITHYPETSDSRRRLVKIKDLLSLRKEQFAPLQIPCDLDSLYNLDSRWQALKKAVADRQRQRGMPQPQQAQTSMDQRKQQLMKQEQQQMHRQKLLQQQEKQRQMQFESMQQVPKPAAPGNHNSGVPMDGSKKRKDISPLSGSSPAGDYMAPNNGSSATDTKRIRTKLDLEKADIPSISPVAQPKPPIEVFNSQLDLAKSQPVWEHNREVAFGNIVKQVYNHNSDIDSNVTRTLNNKSSFCLKSDEQQQQTDALIESEIANLKERGISIEKDPSFEKNGCVLWCSPVYQGIVLPRIVATLPMNYPVESPKIEPLGEHYDQTTLHKSLGQQLRKNLLALQQPFTLTAAMTTVAATVARAFSM